MLIESVIFNGVQPGKSTVADLKRLWGEPDQTSGVPESQVFYYLLEPFRSISIAIEKNLVQSIVVHLAEPLSPELLVTRLKLTGIRPVEVLDDEGTPLGRAFAERGVVFSYVPESGAAQVSHILLEAINAEPFVQRAASRLHGPYEANLADLAHALRLDPQHGRAYWLQAQIFLALGRMDEANEALRMAMRMEPRNCSYRLTWASCLAHQQELEKADREIERALSDTDAGPVERAQAQLQLGQLAAHDARGEYAQATELLGEAIKLAEPLAAASQVAVRRQAQRILVEAHLGVAQAIGCGNWKRKDEVVPKWIAQGEQLADEMIAAGLADPSLRLELAEAELIAYSGFDSNYDPAPRLEQVEQALAQLVTPDADPLWQQRLEWQWGCIFRRAMQIEHSRGRADTCLAYGEQARELLEAVAVGRKSSVAARLQLGKLYFGLGAVRAIHQRDHEGANLWYDKAEALLAPLAKTGPADPALGDMLVSMGVTYWQVELRQKAVEMTSLGAQLLQKAVEQRSVSRSVLAVPYSNLASMHRALGDQQRAEEFVQLAGRVSGAMRQ